MPIFMLVFLGGGTGAICRYGLGQLVGRWLGTGFPYATLIVNLLGALLIGAIVELLALKMSLPPQLRFLLVTGFLGGFTTFSAFSLETALMLQRGDYLQAAVYCLVSVAGTVALVLGTSWLIRQLV